MKTISPVFPSMVSADHNREGILLTLADGSIFHLFRKDSGAGGDHVGNTGAVVARFSFDNGESWTQAVAIFDDPYDDRNISACLTASGRIVVFFRRYDAPCGGNGEVGCHLDANFIFSDDGGVSWSEREQIVTEPVLVFGPGRGTYVPTRGYLICGYGRPCGTPVGTSWSYRQQLRFSKDGSRWDEVAYPVSDAEAARLKLTEPTYEYIGDGRIIGLFRHEEYDNAKPFYQITSGDYGRTWTSPVLCNALSYWGVAPQLYLDPLANELYLLGGDRRGLHSDPSLFASEQMHVYLGDPDTVYADPQAWIEAGCVGRQPLPWSGSFYGYGVCTRTASGRILVIFTENSWDGHESAGIYQFFVD